MSYHGTSAYLNPVSFHYLKIFDFPSQLGAELDRSEACKVLLNEGAPASVWDDSGMSCMSLMILKMPPVVWNCLYLITNFSVRYNIPS